LVFWALAAALLFRRASVPTRHGTRIELYE
jgi:hypothetical protein